MMVNSAGAEAKMQRLQQKVREGLANAIALAHTEVLADVVAHTPSVDQEYDLLMNGGDTAGYMPRAGGSSADTDGRRRLIKVESTYLRPTAESVSNRRLTINRDTGRLQIGNLKLLLMNSRFSYQNYSKDHGLYSPVSKGPYFNAFENGSAGVEIVPRFARKDGSGYPLRPSEDTKVFSMFKSIPAFRSYGGERLIPVFLQVMETELSAIGPGKLRS